LTDKGLKYHLRILVLIFFCWQEIQLGWQAHGFVLLSLEKSRTKLFEHLFFYLDDIPELAYLLLTHTLLLFMFFF
ncbi:hypothetical protein BAE44_0021416, partial [Dichanthelium oligosanthes]